MLSYSMMQPTISFKNFKSLIPSISPFFKSLKSQHISSIQYPLILPSHTYSSHVIAILVRTSNHSTTFKFAIKVHLIQIIFKLFTF
ncbi:hypothetical protein Hanom_Chr06g00551181 [Helianthus anomalus]